MTGAISCCRSYVRQLKISKTAKFWGESSFLLSTMATKEDGSGGAGGRALPLDIHGLGWCFPRQLCFLLCQMPGFDKPGNILSVCLPLHKPSGFNLEDVHRSHLNYENSPVPT